jgi:hypothetical protein
MPREITPATSIDNLRKEAKRWLKALRAADAAARTRFGNAHPVAPDTPNLRDVQHALAHEYGKESWGALTDAVFAEGASQIEPADPLLPADACERLARDYLRAFNARDDAALRRLNDHYRRAFTFDDLWAEIWRRVYSFRQRAFKGASPAELRLDEAQGLVAQDAGFGNWDTLTHAVVTGTPRVPPFFVDSQERRIGPRRHLNRREWDRLIDVMKERRLTRLDAGGLMTDDVLARVAGLDHVTALELGGSRQLTDDGLLQLARMPQLEELILNEYPGGALTDRGLAVLRHLPNLRRFEMMWQRGITDAGVANLSLCDRIESVDLMGSPTGDGAIDALQGHPRPHRFGTGRLVTDAGLRLLRNVPRLRAMPGSPEDTGARLLIDGPFTDDGVASLAGLDGVVDLDLFWHVSAMTSSGFTHLTGMSNLMSIGADGRLSDDEAMRHLGALPRLRALRAQEAAATDAGFEALSRSRTLERFWGRECAHFGNRGFLAFSRMPSLRTLGIGCANVDDETLAALPDFPSLRELTPIGFQDAGFRHVGRCRRLERLTCMYCRSTGDEATEHIAGLPIRYYYAGLTQITDRSLEVLGRIQSLEEVDLYECRGVTDAGLPSLARLPALRQVGLDGLPRVTLDGARVFPPRVRVRYST